MCLSVVSIKTEQGRMNVPCGKCSECLQKRRSEWTFRLLSELKFADSAYFVTLTYEDEKLPLNMNLDKKHCQLFMKRLRKKHDKLKSKQLRYYLVGEYGEKFGRPHYHMILFNCKEKVLIDLEEIWGKGQIYVGTVNQSSIHYVTKYMLQNQYTEKEQKPFSLMSRRPYLGHQYIDDKIRKYHKENMVYNIMYPGGIEQPLPKIYKKRIFNIKEMEELSDMVIKEDTKKHQEYMCKYKDKYQIKVDQKNKADYKKMLKQSKSKLV